jgi:hypothetical protein
MIIAPPSPAQMTAGDRGVQHIDPVMLDEMQVAAAQIATGLDSALR